MSTKPRVVAAEQGSRSLGRFSHPCCRTLPHIDPLVTMCQPTTPSDFAMIHMQLDAVKLCTEAALGFEPVVFDYCVRQS